MVEFLLDVICLCGGILTGGDDYVYVLAFLLGVICLRDGIPTGDDLSTCWHYNWM